MTSEISEGKEGFVSKKEKKKNISLGISRRTGKVGKK